MVAYILPYVDGIGKIMVCMRGHDYLGPLSLQYHSRMLLLSICDLDSSADLLGREEIDVLHLLQCFSFLCVCRREGRFPCFGLLEPDVHNLTP